MSEDPRRSLIIEAEEYGEPLAPNLRQRLESEWSQVEGNTTSFPDDHPYDEALKRTLAANIMTLNCEKIIARHCFHICAQKIREKGPSGRLDPEYQSYISLLRMLPTDWFDEKNGQLLDHIDLWN
jgi:hypothetical protein